MSYIIIIIISYTKYK